VAAILAVGAAVAGYAYVQRQPAVWSATAVTAVDQPKMLAAGSDAEISKLAALRIKYGPLLTTDVMLRPLAAKLGVAEGQLRAALKVNLPDDSLLIAVNAQTPSPTDAVRFANAAAVQLGVFANAEQDANQVSAAQRFSLGLVDQARTAVKVTPTKKRAVAAAASAAVLTFAGVWVLIQLVPYRGRRRRRA
jgi:capsular polysaccharide biosynthesis protein